MKQKRIEKIFLLTTAVFAALMIGFFAGRASVRPDAELRIYTQQGTVQPSSEFPNTEPSGSSSEPPSSEPSVEPVTASQPGQLVNLNTATLEELMTLPNIGQTRAQAILDYREEYGDFLTVEQITEVSGIGSGILESIQDYVTVG